MPIYAQSSTLRNLLIPLVDIDQTTLANEQVLQYNSTTGKFENQALSLTDSGFIIDATNVGSGYGVFKQEAGSVLEFRTLAAGAGVTITQTATDISIATSGANTSAVNIGTGVGVFTSKSGDNIQLRSFKTSTGSINLTVAASGDGNEIEFTNTAEINTASNLGAGEGVFAQKTDQDLEFKSLVAGDNISMSSDSDTITINASSAPATAFVYQFNIGFDGSGNIQTISSLPTGWTYTLAGNIVTIEHGLGIMLKMVSYWGYDATNGWQLRFPTAGYQATVPSGFETTRFKINVNATVAGADPNGQATVNVIF